MPKSLTACEGGSEPPYRLCPHPGNCDGDFCGLVLDGVEPVRIGPRFLQQPVARTQRPVKGVDPACMFGIDRRRQAIEKTSPLRRRANEQRIHRRHQPDDAKVISESRSRSDRFTIDPADAVTDGAVFGFALDAGAERSEPQRAFDFGGDSPGTVTLLECHFLKRGAAQAATGGEKRDRFDQVGFAGAIRPVERDDAAVGLKRRRVVVAEIGQGQAADTDHRRSDIGGRTSDIGIRIAISDLRFPSSDLRHTRIGIST